MGAFPAELPRARLPGFRLRSLSDDRLGRLVAGGDDRAFAVVYERYHEQLYRYCRSIVGDPDDAADALQNTMAAALRGLAGETREIKLKPWLFRIAHNECISMLRGRRPQVAIDESLELIAPEGVDALTRERLRQLVADLQELPVTQRSALVMRELSGLGYEEIAGALGGNVASARQSVFEARSALHELAEGRAMECDAVRRVLSDHDGRVLRGRKLRAHIRACGSCRDFRDLMGSRRRDLAMIAPPIPAAVAAGVLHHLVGGGAATATSGAGAGGGGAFGTLAAGKALAATTAVKAVAIVATTAAVGAGTVETVRQVERHSSAPAKTTPLLPAPPAHKTTVNPPARHSPAAGSHTTIKTDASPTHTATPGKSHSRSGHTQPGAKTPNRIQGHGPATKGQRPEHPSTPAGKQDTPAKGKGKTPDGNARTSPKGPPATTPTPTHTTPTITTPVQAQKGLDTVGDHAPAGVLPNTSNKRR